MSELYNFIIGKNCLDFSIQLKIDFQYKKLKLISKLSKRSNLFILTSDPDVITSGSNVYVCLACSTTAYPIYKFYLVTDKFNQLKDNEVVKVKFLKPENLISTNHIPCSELPKVSSYVKPFPLGLQFDEDTTEFPYLSSVSVQQSNSVDDRHRLEMITLPVILPILLRTIESCFSTSMFRYTVHNFQSDLSRLSNEMKESNRIYSLPDVNSMITYPDVIRSWIIIHPRAEFDNIFHGNHDFCNLHFCLIKWAHLLIKDQFQYSRFSLCCVALLFRIMNEKTNFSSYIEIIEGFKDVIQDDYLKELISKFFLDLPDQSVTDLEFYRYLAKNLGLSQFLPDSITTQTNSIEY